MKKINDERLTPELSRSRNGAKQEFYFKTKTRNPHIDGYEFTLKHPTDRSMYAELIDNEWYWVSGCCECNGQPRESFTYMECEKHNVCVKCSKPRAEAKTAWGWEGGWCCGTCQKIAHEIDKEEALAKMPSDEDYDEWDYHDKDEITCPYCAYEFSDSWECADSDAEEKDCPRCDNTFTFTAMHTLTFDCSRK